jgi:hypothetical protein
VTSDCPETTIPLIAHVTATTDDPNVRRVEFFWESPTWQCTYNAEDIVDGTAVSSAVVNEYGTWRVYIHFNDENGEDQCKLEQLGVNYLEITVVRINHTPEIPIIGTFGALIAMLAGVAFKIRKTNKPKHSCLS